MYILLFISAVIISVYVFTRTYPAFGGTTKRHIKERSRNISGGKFVNQIDTPMTMNIKSIVSLLQDQLKTHPHRKPSERIQSKRLNLSNITASEPHITWFGHSTFLLALSGKTILLDPIFSNAASPIQALGPKRFSDLPATINDLPHIDAVVISHDHYDHLDYHSIQQLSAKTSRFFVPIGLAAHLQKWGVGPDAITELDWWDEAKFDDITFACTPSRHFSGRTLTDRFATLWASWVIKSDDASVYFSGDSGYGPHFKEIGTKYGPFNLTLLECGQYDRHWPNIHMTPEQTMQAHLDLKGKRMIPMHWGTFALALHDWTDSIERVTAAGQNTDARILTPQIGETIAFTSVQPPLEKWWQKVDKPE